MVIANQTDYRKQIYDVIKGNVSSIENEWIETKLKGGKTAILTAFVATPRFISKSEIKTDSNLNIQNWSLDQLVRIFFLLSFQSQNKEEYCKSIDLLFETAEINEYVALISALSYLPYPEYWQLRATDAVRSNIGPVLNAIAFNNTYPKDHFTELAWNQLVLKCIFNDKPIKEIIGLEERSNYNLAQSISNLAHERWAAGRNITPQAWRLVRNFVDESIFRDLEKLLKSDNKNDNLAAALVSLDSKNPNALELLKNHAELVQEIKQKNISWAVID